MVDRVQLQRSRSNPTDSLYDGSSRISAAAEASTFKAIAPPKHNLTYDMQLHTPKSFASHSRTGSGSSRSREEDDGRWHCSQCGVTSTPEKRSGPQGKRSLCNGCGLKWRKTKSAEQLPSVPRENASSKNHSAAIEFLLNPPE